MDPKKKKFQHGISESAMFVIKTKVSLNPEILGIFKTGLRKKQNERSI
jgi:hypothetical protein